MLYGLYNRVQAITEARNSLCGCSGDMNSRKRLLKCDIGRPELNRVAIVWVVGQRPFD